MMTLTPFTELARRVSDVRAWHQPKLHAKNQALPKCRECGFTWPCRTYERLTDPGRTDPE